ncbi:hypothetical protein LPB86_16850 [Pedobacter sp. MC2016-14]|uniref:STM3941 family protein n=1 Tax=Pedobacter sp. MC2016-14 TaxID=2897327 RepID=UPI001E3367D3|nr:STM3941 family protein [Pedobacter sp. MC2016-14]MCD0489913.1 hypothetical protein [Pedobacter sp. MC2016-14]
MEKIEIYSSKSKSLLLLIASVLFVIGGIYMLLNAEYIMDYRMKNILFIKGVGIFSIIFFGLGIYVSINRLIKNQLILIIDRTGLNINPNSSSSEKIEWNNIDGFSEMKVQSSRFVIINVNNSDYWIEKEKNKLKKNLMKFNVNNYGSPFNLSAHTMQINHDELMGLLNTSLTNYKLDVN